MKTSTVRCDLKETLFNYSILSLLTIALLLSVSLFASEDKNINDSTECPASNELQIESDPNKLLENGKNPGLGIRSLHKEGINGAGVNVAIIDQSLLVSHVEYASRLIRYDATALGWKKEPMYHGSVVASVLVGQTLGVAPQAELTYYAVSTLGDLPEYYIRSLDKIIALNKTLPEQKRIRVVSISDGRQYDRWQQACKRAEKEGILVVSCARAFLDFGTLKLIEGKDPDNPENYVPGKYKSSGDVLRIPAANRTFASEGGIHEYTYDREGGLSWAAPYIAGLAALAFQIDPDSQPQTIVKQLVKTAKRTKAGPVVNPRGFIKSMKAIKLNKESN